LDCIPVPFGTGELPDRLGRPNALYKTIIPSASKIFISNGNAFFAGYSFLKLHVLRCGDRMTVRKILTDILPRGSSPMRKKRPAVTIGEQVDFILTRGSDVIVRSFTAHLEFLYGVVVFGQGKRASKTRPRAKPNHVFHR
jgi:hypothetical protein